MAAATEFLQGSGGGEWTLPAPFHFRLSSGESFKTDEVLTTCSHVSNVKGASTYIRSFSESLGIDFFYSLCVAIGHRDSPFCDET